MARRISKLKLLLVYLLLFLCSCQGKEAHHKNLILFDHQFLRDLTEEEFDSYTTGKEIKEIISSQQSGDTLLATVDFPWSGCADMAGDLRYSNDTLNLIYKLKEEILCSEVIFYRLNYKIFNPESRKYKLTLHYEEQEK